MIKRLTLPSALLILFAFSGILHANEAFTTTPEGLQYKDLKMGTGPIAKNGDVAVIHFVGWLNDSGQPGREIYNTRKQNKHVAFQIGTDKVMQGWNIGVIGMQAGGMRILRIPPKLGYGNRAVDKVIPAQAHLVFVVELLELK